MIIIFWNVLFITNKSTGNILRCICIINLEYMIYCKKHKVNRLQSKISNFNCPHEIYNSSEYRLDKSIYFYHPSGISDSKVVLSTNSKYGTQTQKWIRIILWANIWETGKKLSVKSDIGFLTYLSCVPLNPKITFSWPLSIGHITFRIRLNVGRWIFYYTLLPLEFLFQRYYFRIWKPVSHKVWVGVRPSIFFYHSFRYFEVLFIIF